MDDKLDIIDDVKNVNDEAKKMLKNNKGEENDE